LFKFVTFVSCGALASTAITPAFAQDATTILQPSTDWLLEYGEDRCRLARMFGEGDDQTVFWIEQNGPSATFSWLTAGGVVDRLGAIHKVGVTFGSFAEYEVSGVNRPSTRFSPRMKDNPSSKMAFTLDRFGEALRGNGYRRGKRTDAKTSAETEDEQVIGLDPSDGAKIDFVDFARSERRIRLATGNLRDPFAAMNACAIDLYEEWGIDASEFAAIAEGPKPKNMRDIARKIQRHYPRDAERRGEAAIMKLKIIVAANGSVERCILINDTKAENFDDFACEVMNADAHFEPARNENGDPIRGLYSTKIYYYTK